MRYQVIRLRHGRLMCNVLYKHWHLLFGYCLWDIKKRKRNDDWWHDYLLDDDPTNPEEYS